MSRQAVGPRDEPASRRTGRCKVTNRLRLAGLKELLLAPQRSRDPAVASTIRARALFRPPEAAKRHLGLVEFLKQTVIFEALDPRELGRLARIVHEREYGDGEYICEQGKPGAALFVLRRGTVEVVSRGSDGGEVPLAALEPPASFEEWAAVETEGTHWYSVRARGPVSLLALGKSDVDAMMLNFPVLANKVLMKLAGIMALRLHVLVEDVLGSEPRPESDR